MRIINSKKDYVDLRLTRQEYNDFLQVKELDEVVMLELIGFDPRTESKEDLFQLQGGIRCETKAKIIAQSGK